MFAILLQTALTAILPLAQDGKVGQEPAKAVPPTKAIRGGQIAFDVVVGDVVWIPAETYAQHLNLGLKIANNSDTPFVISNDVRFTVTTPDGKQLRRTVDEDRVYWPPQPVTIEAHQETILWCSYAFVYGAGAGESPMLRGIAETGYFWYFHDLYPGSYLVYAEFEGKESVTPAAAAEAGKVKTEAAKFRVINLRESTPVQVKGVEFRAATEPQVIAPVGQSWVTFGFSITNLGKRPLQFELFETFHLVLKSIDGKQIDGNWEREETCPLDPVVVSTGKKETVRLPAYSLYKGTAEEGICLYVGDGSGGEYAFEGLVPGKYLLSFFVYGNPGAVPVAATPPFWYGSVHTTDVEFEIIVPGKNGNTKN